MQSRTSSSTDSQSVSDRTLVGGDYGPFSAWDAAGISSPIIQTPDQKQWIDLDFLNPKLLKGLREYAPSIKDESEGRLGKGAARIKAWARQSKAGIDIRLRRRVNAGRDEITDIRLVPDSHPSVLDKPPVVQELAAMQRVAELPDTSISLELEAASPGYSSRSSTGGSFGEPLPRYEAEPGASSSISSSRVEASQGTTSAPSPSAASSRTGDVSPMQVASVRHQPSVSQSSIVATPRRGLSLRDVTHAIPAGSEAKDDSRTNAILLEADLEEARKKLNEERELSESLQAIIAVLNEEHPSQKPSLDEAIEPRTTETVGKPRIDRLKVVGRTTYETETDCEPALPALRRRKNKARKAGATNSKHRVFARRSPVNRTTDSDASDGELDAAACTLIRQQTLPKRVAAIAGFEAVWSSLLHMQTILLGPDHTLTVQAQSDLTSSKADGTQTTTADLSALQQSKSIAAGDFGSDHPWVAAFSEDLEKLTSLLQPKAVVPEDRASRLREVDAREPSSETASVRSTMPQQRNDLSSPDLVVTEANATPPASGISELQKINTSVQSGSPDKEPSPVVGGVEIDDQLDVIWNTGWMPHQPQNNHLAFLRLGFAAVSQVAWNGLHWLQRNYGPEPSVEPGKTRVRWTCSCGERLHDDFVEKRPGAARALEAYLNRPKGATLSPPPAAHLRARPRDNDGSPTTAGSSPGGRSFGSSFGAPPSSHTSLSNNSFPNGGSWANGDDSKPQQTWSGMPSQMPFSPTYEPPWLLTCATEDRFTPKVTHLDMSRHKIHSDKDLANSLREHYFHVNKKWWKGLRLRGLTTIEFVQFEAHQNRFADIRKVPDVPLKGRPDYSFEPSDLLPPVGSHYLLHLFKHPEDYDGELITYLRSPKKSGRLQLGVGWGVHLVEGFLADKVWVWMSLLFALGSLVFGVVYAVKEHDVQGAFGVAAWISTLGVLAAGWLQACLGQATQARASKNSIGLVASDVELVHESDYVFSIVPPRDAFATANRIATASQHAQRERPSYFIDLNAISPQSARQINDLFPSTGHIRYIDGGIIGAPPSPQSDDTWYRPSIPVSGPHRLAHAEPVGEHLEGTLNVQHVDDAIGSATGLKMCFASLSKGHTALAIQAFTTARRLGVLAPLKEAMGRFNPAGLRHAETSLPSMCPKAYRWVEEMRQIGETFGADGGFEPRENVFAAVAEVYELVASGTELGREVVGERVRGRTAEDVALLMGEGIDRRKVKTE